MNPQNSFEGLGIAPKILQILTDRKFSKPTPIQHQAIPVAVQGKDVIGIAQTGTGKTLAFGVPMLQILATHKGQGLVLLPTRELALQVEESLTNIGRSLGLKTAVLIGGESMGRQIQQLRRSPHVVIATPGRLIDFLDQKAIKLDQVKILVLDEADRMLDMGFAPQIKQILAHVPTPDKRQTMLFSATMPAEIASIAVHHMKMPVRVEVAPAGTTAKDIEQEVFFVNKADKLSLLEKILTEYKGSVLVFSRTKFGAKKITTVVNRMGHTAAEIHSNRSLNQRLEALKGFKSGKYRVLIATDIAARGIDVTGIELVINYDLPQAAEDYVHRIGRTARAGKAGRAISFATPDQRFDVRSIERLIKMALPVSQAKGLPPVSVAVPSSARPPREFSRSARPHGSQHSQRSARPEHPHRSFARPSAGSARPQRGFKSHAQPYDSRPEGSETKPGEPFVPRSKFRARFKGAQPQHPTGVWRRNARPRPQRSNHSNSGWV